MKKHFIEAKTFGGFVTFYLPCVIKHCKDVRNAINLQHGYLVVVFFLDATSILQWLDYGEVNSLFYITT